VLALLLLGCVHRVQVTTVPVGATLYRNEARLGEAPVEVRVPIFSSRHVEARLPGYRSVTTVLPRVGPMSYLSDVFSLHWGQALGLRDKAVVEIRLMPDHGPVGTWEPEIVP